MTFQSFHFLRPAWLAALGLLVPLVWWAWRRQRHGAGWERVCEPHLLQHLLTAPGSGSGFWPLAWFALAWVSTCFALAGPTWEHLPQAAFEEPSRTIFVLGLGPSMNQRDVAPSRLARARHKLQDAIDQLGGSVALVVYREEAFPATPLTDDTQVMRELIPLLETQLTPGKAVLPGRGIETAADLLKPVGLTGAQILLVTDGADDDPAATRAAAVRVAREGAHVSVLGVAGEEASLSALAAEGGGRYAALSANDDDLEWLLGDGDVSLGTSLAQSEVKTDAWRDMGVWLVWIPLLLAPLAFRKGWVMAAFAAILIQLPANSASAGVRDWFERPDERGSRAFAEEQYEAAAERFEDPSWQAAARYRAGDYEGAAKALEGRSGPDSDYNRGNALAKAGQLENALAAYEHALAEKPEDDDARFNRDLVKQLLEAQQKPASSGETSEGDSKPEDGGVGKPQAPDAPASGEDEAAGAEAPTGSAGQQSPTTQASRPQSAGPDPEIGEEAARTADASESQATPGDTSLPEGDSNAEAGEGAEPEAKPEGGASWPGASTDSQVSDAPPGEPGAAPGHSLANPQDQDTARWMARLPDDPGGLLREKIRRDYLRKRQMRLRGERP